MENLTTNPVEMLRVFGQVFYHIWWIIFPTAFFYLFKTLWTDYVVFAADNSWAGALEWTLLEIIPPKDIEKSPKLFESIYTGLTGVLTTHNVFDVYMKGAFIDRFSLELVGEEGRMHFYIRTQKKYRNLVEAQVYAQYPNAEVLEAEDYTEKFPKVIPNKNWDLWGTDFEFVNPAPFPIKTYDKFEESITGEMIDPMSALAEVIGKLGPGQHIWLQYILDPQPEPWKKDQMKEVQKLAGRISGEEGGGILKDLSDVVTSIPKGILGPVEFPKSEKKEEQPLEFRLTPVEKDVLKAVEENLSKNFFKVKMRYIYLGRKENFDRTFVSSFVGAVKQFNDQHLNQFKPHDISKTYANFLLKKERLAFRQRKIYRRYKERDMDGATIFMSTAELATVFHFPDMGVKAPSVARVESTLGSAPSNLPVE